MDRSRHLLEILTDCRNCKYYYNADDVNDTYNASYGGSYLQSVSVVLWFNIMCLQINPLAPLVVYVRGVDFNSFAFILLGKNRLFFIRYNFIHFLLN